jgi:hypothetical protein
VETVTVTAFIPFSNTELFELNTKQTLSASFKCTIHNFFILIFFIRAKLSNTSSSEL